MHLEDLGARRVSLSVSRGREVLASWTRVRRIPRATTTLEHQRSQPLSDFRLLDFSMPSGVALSEDARGIVIFMHDSRSLNAKSISYFTGIPLRTVQHILSTWKATGEVKPVPEGQRGRPRALDFGDTEVRCAQIHRATYRRIFDSVS